MNPELYAYADFCGLWNVYHLEDPISVCNITEYIATLAGLTVRRCQIWRLKFPPKKLWLNTLHYS